MMWFDKEYNYTPKVDNAEMYRQHYEDALDEIHNLRYRIKELEVENKLLTRDVEGAENFILHYRDGNREF